MGHAPGADDRSGHGGESILPPRTEHDAEASGGQAHGRRSPDPAACPGHDCDAALDRGSGGGGRRSHGGTLTGPVDKEGQAGSAIGRPG